MKKFVRSATVFVLALALAFSLAGCGSGAEKGLWETAIYSTDTELGEGRNTLCVEVTAEDKSVTFTIHTDQEMVGEALSENGLIAGEEGDYGLYVKTVNGMTADYDVDQSYWAFYIDGEYAETGVDSTEITEGTAYELAYTK